MATPVWVARDGERLVVVTDPNSGEGKAAAQRIRCSTGALRHARTHHR